MVKLGRFSIGVGDRFGREGRAQIAAAEAIRAETGIELNLVWNKSKREHSIIGTLPLDQRRAADEAVAATKWRGSYFVDADHISAVTVEPFLDHCDFFTIDVAETIGKKADMAKLEFFVSRNRGFIGEVRVEGLAAPLEITGAMLRSTAERYLAAVVEAGAVYRKILERKGAGNFVVEVSMDETEVPQTPAELFFILKALADEGVPVDTIAPKFSGRFNKGVDYVGNAEAFAAEFEADVLIARHAARSFGLPADLKLSVHSGSDKFSLYPHVARIARETGAGFHLKTAGTSWLEELVGLAEAGGAGLAMAKQIYRVSFGRFDELVGPYATVVDIDRSKLPNPDAVDRWTASDYAAALRHDKSEARFDRNFRQLLHVGYKVAAELGSRYLDALEECRESVERNVRDNLLERHFRPLFGRS
jgi:hypothetical protein